MARTVSVISTVRNECHSIGRLLDSLAAQTRSPDEVLIVDGGSSDGTVDILREHAESSPYPLRVLVRKGANRSEGRNVAIRMAEGDIIACTDAGVRLSPGWLEALLQPFVDDEETQVVAGFFVTDPRTPFELAMGSTVLPMAEDIDPDRFLPSSRSVAFGKTVWEAVDGYPEWMEYSEDTLYDLALRLRGYHFAFAPQALVFFRPRSSLRSFWRQYAGYAYGDAQALLWPLRHLVRYGMYLVACPTLVAAALLHHPLWWLMVIPGLAFYLRTPYRRLARLGAGMPLSWRIRAGLWVPAIRLVGDLAKMAGYPRGLSQGVANRARVRSYLGEKGQLRGLFPFRS